MGSAGVNECGKKVKYGQSPYSLGSSWNYVSGL